jgi:hypothetical protein
MERIVLTTPKYFEVLTVSVWKVTVTEDNTTYYLIIVDSEVSVESSK